MPSIGPCLRRFIRMVQFSPRGADWLDCLHCFLLPCSCDLPHTKPMYSPLLTWQCDWGSPRSQSKFSKEAVKQNNEANFWILTQNILHLNRISMLFHCWNKMLIDSVILMASPQLLIRGTNLWKRLFPKQRKMPSSWKIMSSLNTLTKYWSHHYNAFPWYCAENLPAYSVI